MVALYDKFKSKMKGTVNTGLYNHDKGSGEGTSRELIKNVSDIVWNSLSRSYMTDKAHLQSLYTYLTGNEEVFCAMYNVHIKYEAINPQSESLV